MWFDVTPSDLSYTESSPFRFENEAIINASPERVFQIVTDDRVQHAWFKDFVGCRWTSPEPHGVGSTREIALKTVTVKERFLVWDPGERLAFTLTAITAPLVQRMVEDLRFEPLGGRTRLRWTAHYTPTPAMRAVHPIARAIFGRMFAASTNGLASYATRVDGAPDA